MRQMFRLPFLIGLVMLAVDRLYAAEATIRVGIQLIELPSVDLTKLLAETDNTGPKLHAAVMALTRQSDAKLIDCAVLTSLSQINASLASIRHRAYPANPEPPEGGRQGSGYQTDRLEWGPNIVGRPGLAQAWQTRQVGMALELEANLSQDGKWITLRIAPEWVGMATPTTWVEYTDFWGDASVRQPTFTVLRCATSHTLVPGQFALAAVLTPQPEPSPPAVSRKALVFVRADVVR